MREVEVATSKSSPRGENLLLKLDHSPLVRWPRILGGNLLYKPTSGEYLNVYCAEVRVDEAEVDKVLEYAAEVTRDRRVKVKVLRGYEDSSVSAVVSVKTSNFLPRTDLASILLAKGHGSVLTFDHDLEHSAVYEKYYKQLIKAESKASAAGLGMWQAEEKDAKPSQSLIRRILDRLWS